MQVHSFSNGSYVAHRVCLDGSTRRFSMWFDGQGRVTDAEGLDRLGRSGPVSRGQRASLQRRAEAWVRAGGGRG